MGLTAASGAGAGSGSDVGSVGSNTKPRWFDFASVLAVVAIWTLFSILVRLGVKGDFTAWDLAFLRFTFAAAAVLPFWLRRPAGRRFGALTPGRALVVATTGGLMFTLIAYAGFSFAPAAHGAVLMTGTLPFWVALAGWFALSEGIGRRKLFSLLLILLGVAFLGWQALMHSGAQAGAWRGDLLFPLASASWAVFVVLLRRWQVNALDATIASALLCCLVYTPVYVLLLPKQIMEAPWSAILWQGVFQGMLAMVLSMWLYTRVVQAFGPSRTAMVTAVCPGLAALIAVPVLGEPLSALILFGLAAVTAGMLLGVTGGHAAEAVARTPAAAAPRAPPRSPPLV